MDKSSKSVRSKGPKGSKKSKHTKKSKTKLDANPELLVLKNLINNIVDISGYNTDRIKTKMRKEHIELIFLMKKVGAETDDRGLLILKLNEMSNLMIVFRPDKDNDKNLTNLMIGRKIVMDYLLTYKAYIDDTLENIDTSGFLSIPNENIQSVIFDLIGNYSSRNGYYYFDLCMNCHRRESKRTNKSVKNARGTLDLYSRLCRECLIATSGQPTTNVVIDAYQKDSNIVKFLLLISLEALDSKDRFTPFPNVNFGGKILTQYNDVVSSFAKISRDMKYWITKLDAADTDLKLFNSLSNSEYKFIEFVVQSNNTILSHFDFQSKPIAESSDDLIIDTDVWNNSGLMVFAITHDAQLEDQFNKVEKSTYLFHGSAAENWHSILRNGLKNYSGTAKQTNGAAFGSGIYLAKNSSISMGYSRRSKSGFSVISIAQVIDAERYNKNKSAGIYVVPDESQVLIKYLILINNSNQGKELDKIFKYLTFDLPFALDCNRGCMTSITDRRLQGEYADLRRDLDSINSDISLDESITELVIELADKLKSRIWTIKYQETEIKIDISYQYPLVAPKITIITKEDLKCLPLAIKENDDKTNEDDKTIKIEKDDNIYRYLEPKLNYLSWNPGTKIWPFISFILRTIIGE